MEPMPLAGGFTASRSEALAAEKFPIVWMKCNNCELVQVEEDIPDEVLYKKYNYASSDVKALDNHFREYADFIKEGTSKPIRVLEIGCNDGVLLRKLPKEWDLYGVDPSDVARNSVLENPGNYSLINHPFNSDRGFKNIFDLVITSNCLAHMSDLGGVIKAVSESLKPGGQFLVEVHDLEETLRTGQWDTIYHEHKAEYSVESLQTACDPHELRLMVTTKLPLHGGIIRACFQKIEGMNYHAATSTEDDSFDKLENNYRNRRVSSPYLDLIGKRVVAYGASGRATVWFNQMPELEIKAVIDDSPLRQGKFVPGVGYPIVSWEDKPDSDYILITAWN